MFFQFLFILLKKENLFSFNVIFLDRFVRILFATIAMGIFFNFLIIFLNEKIIYAETFKSVYLIATVVLGLAFYILAAMFINAFKISDINLKY